MFIVYDEDMNEKILPEGSMPLDVYIPSVRKVRTTSRVEGINGVIDYGYVYERDYISVDVGMLPYDTKDYRLLRDEIYNFFHGHDHLYISEKYQRGKRYQVKAVESFIPDRLTRTMAQASFSFEMNELPFAESIGTTADIDKNGLNYGDGWSYGMGLLYDDESHIYTHTESNFRIYNAGNVPVHPFEQDLVIRVISLKNTSEPYELRNVTNGSVFRINDGLSMGQTVVLDGPNITSDGAQFLSETNRGFIELDSGWNEFVVSGSGISVVSFDFRFYYL